MLLDIAFCERSFFTFGEELLVTFYNIFFFIFLLEEKESGVLGWKEKKPKKEWGEKLVGFFS